MPRISDLLRPLEDWGGLVALAVAACLLWLGFRVESLGRAEAMVIAYALPAVAILLAAMPVQGVRGRARAICVAAIVLGLPTAECTVFDTISPPHAFGAVALGRAGAGGDVDVPGDASRFVVSVHGSFDEASGSTAADYTLVFSRGDATARATGRLSRDVRRSGRRSRRSAPSSTVVVHETDRHVIELAGSGPVHVQLASASGAMPRSFQVSLARPRRWGSALPWLLAATVAAAALAQAAAARHGRRVLLAPGAAVAVVFAATTRGYFNPDDPFKFFVGAAMLAVLAGGLGGWALGSIACALTRRAAATSPEPGASGGGAPA